MRDLLWEIASNIYVKWIFLLCASYVIVGAFGFPLNQFDYIFVIYAFAVNEINEDNALKYALFFGIFYDLNYSLYFGIGVLLFQLLNYIKVQVYTALDMGKSYSRFLFIISITTLYTLITLKNFSYSGYAFWYNLGYFIFMDLLVIMAAGLIIGGKRVISNT